VSWLAGIFTYVLIWWVVLFAVLPWGIKVPDQPEPGHASSAPTNPRLWLKVLITTGVAFVVWLALYYVIESGFISLRPD
jgi:predicted secreted protein